MRKGYNISKAQLIDSKPFLSSLLRPLGLLSALLIVTPAESANLVQAITAYDAGNQTHAYEMFEDLALDGQARATAWVGYLLERGEGTAQDLEEAARWYREGGTREDTVAQYRLGFFYEHGKGVEQDFEQAKRWYTEAANQGDANAQYGLARLYR